MRILALLPLITLTFACGMPAAAELVVIAHPNSGIEHLNKDEVINIYMGRYRKLSSGVTALPVDLAIPPGDKAHFYMHLMGKELAEINSYWARLMFSGQASPPRQALNADEMMDVVSNSRGAIGYIDKKHVDKRVKVVLDLSN